MTSKIECKVFSAHYSCFKSELVEFKLAHNNAAFALQNNSLEPIVREVPRYEPQGEWSYRDQNTQEYVTYQEEINQKIEEGYQKGQQFFQIEESSFALAKGREQTWSESSDQGRFNIRREIKWKRLNVSHELTLQSHEILIAGFADQVSQIELFFSSQNKDVITIPLKKSAIKLSLDGLVHTGAKFGSGVILRGNQVQVVGKWKEVISQDIKAMLRKCSEQQSTLYSEKEFIKLLRKRWKGAPSLRIDRIVDSAASKKYRRNKKLREEKYSTVREEVLFQLAEPDSFQDYERELRNFEEALLEEREVIAFSVLLDNTLQIEESQSGMGPPISEGGRFYDAVMRNEKSGVVYSVFDRTLAVPLFKLKRKE